ncbi:Boophilin-H2 [Holothuria leucospilota]|uniref:Boophilin-H2 n=1 Tax=Holothuria leucospilota TaxID=206669 RepID=A0A9Q1C4R9_HOLLE|nr:Boophilin-H2 [Holothuria leucospilota]
MKISCFFAVGVFACILQKTWGSNLACDLPADPGSCHGFFPRYYYDTETSLCLIFIYGGCGGNENIFESEEECQSACSGSQPSSSSASVCDLPADPGSCHGFFPRYYYDAETSQCQFFIYGGCGGNENIFESEEECQAACYSSPSSSSGKF